LADILSHICWPDRRGEGVGMTGGSVMKSATRESSAHRAKMTVGLGLLIALVTTGSARAEIATPEQKKACTPDVYRLCAGEIPNARARLPPVCGGKRLT
jgi:hypothetical protein